MSRIMHSNNLLTHTDKYLGIGYHFPSTSQCGARKHGVLYIGNGDPVIFPGSICCAGALPFSAASADKNEACWSLFDLIRAYQDGGQNISPAKHHDKSLFLHAQ